MSKVIVFIDGFNLYFGLKAIKRKDLYWLDLVKLGQNLLKNDQTLVGVKYFTSRISYPPDKVKRQGAFIEAIEELANIEIFYGNYLSTKKTCRNCGFYYYEFSEKKTDVNLAIELLVDAYLDKYDTAIVVSGDSDLSGAISKVLALFPNKRVITAFPPLRVSKELITVSTATINIRKQTLQRSLLPLVVTKSDGFLLECPQYWRK